MREDKGANLFILLAVLAAGIAAGRLIYFVSVPAPTRLEAGFFQQTN